MPRKVILQSVETRAGHIKVKLMKGIDVRKLDMLIACCVLGAKG